MIGRLRRHHQHRYELPLVSAPAEFRRRAGPIDPYALGLLLGDGCLTTVDDAELRDRRSGARRGARGRARRDRGGCRERGDYVLRNRDGGRGGVIVANPVTAALRETGARGHSIEHEVRAARTTCSTTPRRDSACCRACSTATAGPVDPARDGPAGSSTRRARRRSATTSCSWSGRSAASPTGAPQAAGRQRPAAAAGATIAIGRVRHRHPPPGGIEPFRLVAQARDLRGDGGGRPMRFIESHRAGRDDARPSASRSQRADSLYVTDDFLVTHNTLNDSFIILDEAQNTTPEQMKMFLTRLGLRLEDGRHRRRHADRPAARPAVRAHRRRRRSSRRSRASTSSGSGARTSCATGSCSGSSRPTTSTPSARRPELRAADRRRA